MKKIFVILFTVLSLSLFGFSSNVLAAVNLNTATKSELETVKGIGPAKADAIIAYRAKSPFKSVDDLDNVKGFGKKSIDKIRSEVTVSGTSKPVATEAKADKKK